MFCFHISVIFLFGFFVTHQGCYSLCLQTDQVDVRIKALNLAGRIFAQPKHCFGGIYQDLFAEFLRRFSDKSAEVRIAALKCGKQCYLANPSGNKASGVLSNIYKAAFSFFFLGSSFLPIF